MWWRRASGSSESRRQLTVLIDESALLCRMSHEEPVEASRDGSVVPLRHSS